MTDIVALPAINLFVGHLSDLGFAENTVLAYERDLKRWRGVGNTHADRARAIRTSGLSPRTIRRQLASHSKFYQWTKRPAGDNPYVRGPSVGLVVPTVVPGTDEMLALVAAEANPMLRCAWALMAGAGLRVSEVASLRWSDIHDEGPFVRVLGKGSKVRDVPLSGAVFHTILEYVGASLPTDPRMFPVSVRTLQRRLKRACVVAGLPPTWHPHALRHGFATAVYDGTKDPLTTAELLGHSSLEMTRVYAHISAGTHKKAVEFALPT